MSAVRNVRWVGMIQVTRISVQLLGLLILSVGIRFAVELTIRPEELFTIRALEPGT